MTDKLEIRGEKIKEKFEEKAKEKQEAEKIALTGEKKDAPKTEKKEKPKTTVKKPVVSEATAKSNYVPVSTKESVEVCRAIRGKNVEKAIAFLERVIEMKEAVPYLRYRKEVAHRPGKIAAGRYPIKTSKQILSILKSAIANAKYLNLNEKMCYVKISTASRAVSKEKQGRYSNISITVAESKEKAKESKKKIKGKK